MIPQVKNLKPLCCIKVVPSCMFSNDNDRQRRKYILTVTAAAAICTL